MQREKLRRVAVGIGNVRGDRLNDRGPSVSIALTTITKRGQEGGRDEWLKNLSWLARASILLADADTEPAAMLSGKRFRLESPTAAIEKVDGKDVAVIIPAGVIIKVISGPRHGSAMMDVLFDGRVVMVFSTDVEQRGTELVA